MATIVHQWRPWKRLLMNPSSRLLLAKKEPKWQQLTTQVLSMFFWFSDIVLCNRKNLFLVRVPVNDQELVYHDDISVLLNAWGDRFGSKPPVNKITVRSKARSSAIWIRLFTRTCLSRFLCWKDARGERKMQYDSSRPVNGMMLLVTVESRVFLTKGEEWWSIWSRHEVLVLATRTRRAQPVRGGFTPKPAKWHRGSQYVNERPAHDGPRLVWYLLWQQ